MSISALVGSNWTSMKGVSDGKKKLSCDTKFCGWSHSSSCVHVDMPNPAGCDKPTHAHAPRWYKRPSVEKTSLEIVMTIFRWSIIGDPLTSKC